MISRKLCISMTAVLLLMTAVFPSMADDCYINDVGHAIIIQDNDDGRTKVIFDLGKDSFTAEGPRLTSIVLTQYVGKDKERFASHKNGPETAIEFSKNLAKVKTSKSSPWNIPGVKGDYHHLDLPLMVEKLRDNEHFLQAEKQMETAMQSLLAATPAEQQNDIMLAKKNWQEETAEKTAMDILRDSRLTAGSANRIIETIPEAYIDVVASRARWLTILAKQQQNPLYIPVFQGTIHKIDKNGDNIDIMLRPEGQHSSLYLCSLDTPACNQAENLLAEKKTATVQATGKLDISKGFIQGNYVIPVKPAEQPFLPTSGQKP